MENPSVLEAEIAELSRKIAEKRKTLEGQNNIVDEKELVKSAVQEKIGELTPTTSAPQTTSTVTPTSLPTTNLPAPTHKPSYLDSLEPSAVQRINDLVQLAVDHGLKKALADVAGDEPFLIDAFHDAIADRYYEELIRHNSL